MCKCVIYNIIIYSPEFGGSFCQGSAREYDTQLCNTNVSMHLSYSIQFILFIFRSVHKVLLVLLISNVPLLIIGHSMVFFMHGKNSQEMV